MAGDHGAGQAVGQLGTWGPRNRSRVRVPPNGGGARADPVQSGWEGRSPHRSLVVSEH